MHTLSVSWFSYEYNTAHIRIMVNIPAQRCRRRSMIIALRHLVNFLLLLQPVLLSVNRLRIRPV